MTREQVDQLLQHADDCISREMQRLSVAGAGLVTVSQDLVSVAGRQEDDRREVPVPTWLHALYIELSIDSSISGEAEIPYTLAGWLSRPAGTLFTTSVWQQTQIINLTQSDESVYTRRFDMLLASRAYEPGASSYDEASFRQTLRVEIEELNEAEEVVRDYTIVVGRTPVSRSFEAKDSEQLNILRLKSLTPI